MTTVITTRSTQVSQARLYRLAQRLLRVMPRHVSDHPVLAAVWEAIRLNAEAFIAAYDAIRQQAPQRRRELQEGRSAIAELYRVGNSWVAWVDRDIETFDATEYDAHITMPDDVIAQSRRLVGVVSTHQQEAPAPLPYGDQLVTELQAAIDAAEKEWGEAQAALGAEQAERSNARELAGKVQSDLVAVRRTLRNVLGSSHRDYQKLRLARTSHVDEEDLEAEEGTAAPGDPVNDPEEPAIPVPADEDTDTPNDKDEVAAE